MAIEGEQERYRTFRIRHGTKHTGIQCAFLKGIVGIHSAMLHAVFGLAPRQGQMEPYGFIAPSGYVIRVSVAGTGIRHGRRANTICAATDLHRTAVLCVYGYNGGKR